MVVISVHISFLHLVDIVCDLTVVMIDKTLNCFYNLCFHKKSLLSLMISETD